LAAGAGGARHGLTVAITDSFSPRPLHRKEIEMKLSWRGASRWVAAAALAAGSAAPASAQDNFWLQVGGFRPSVDTNLRIDDPFAGAQGTPVDLESDLGLSRRKTLTAVLAGMRFGDRWRLELEHFRLDRSVNQFALQRAIRVEDTTFPVSALIDTQFDSRIFRISGGYSFVRNPSAEVGLVFGVHLTEFDIAIQGTFSAGGGAPATFRSEAKDATVPLPTAGLFASFALAPGLSLNARGDVFSLRRDGYDGRLVNAQANVTYRFVPNLGIGVGYRFNDYRIEADRGDFTGRFDYEFKGPQVFLEARF
jgi:hypothetical protein